ncbi:MAG: hypothetical protein OXL41_07750 [Nitrospinae bacterium]|nr:hypothetical protein [Nitrospinota bacterium]
MQKDDLRNLLSALVDDCGYDAVREALEDFDPARKRSSVSKNSPAKRHKKTRAKPNAVSIVDSLALPDEGKKKVLMALARKFEEKAFMPNVNHVRAFLEQEGKDVSRIKSRGQVVSTVFKRLADWETSRLQELETRGLYGPTKSLSVIAKSIENFGRRTRQDRTKDTKRIEKMARVSSR